MRNYITVVILIQLLEFKQIYGNICTHFNTKNDVITTFIYCYNKTLNINIDQALINRFVNSYDNQSTIIDLIKLIQLTNTNSGLKNCFKPACDLFSSCEYSISLESNSFESDSLVASRLASLITGLTYNEVSDSTAYLNNKNLNSLLEFALLDNDNVYESKIIFKNSDQKSLDLQATKSLKNKTIEIIKYKELYDNSASNFKWYRRWFVENKPIEFKAKQQDYKLKLQNQIDIMHPTASDLNSIKFVSDISYDCLNAVWKRVVSVPFLYPNNEIRGIVVISISLDKQDIKQCGNNTNNNSSYSAPDPFYNTDKCDRQTTDCIDLEGKGFLLDSYYCKCKPGYYRNKSANLTYSCLKCSEGCETCIDDKPCITDVILYYKQVALIVNLTCIFFCILLIFLTWYHMSLNSLKTSSVKMLIMVLLGSIVSYSELIPMYFPPNYWTCTTAQILQLEGFLLTYGALVLKTWRECKLFYVRSIRTIKITEKSLMKRLGIIMLIGTVYLLIWGIRKVDSPREIEVYDTNNLMYKMCSITEWNFVSMAIQSCVLLWGVILSIQVGRASITFKETKLITWSIFNECVVTCFVITISVLIKNTKVSCYVPFILNFSRIHLQITVMLLLLFSYKIYTLILSRKKPFQSNQSNLLNFSGSVKDIDQKNSSINEETEKERELKIEIQRLYRQIEEMRSLSMRIANLHLLTKKSRFIAYPTKKLKSSKTKNFLLPENEVSKQLEVADVVAEKIYGKLKTIDEETEKLNSIQLSRTKSKNK